MARFGKLLSSAQSNVNSVLAKFYFVGDALPEINARLCCIYSAVFINNNSGDINWRACSISW